MKPKNHTADKTPLAPLFFLMAFFLTSAFTPNHLVRLTVINKADIEVALRLENERYDLSYYLSIPKGDPDDPVEKTFTIVPAVYTISATYLETYDPVYGYPYCGGKSLGGSYNLTVHSRMVIPACKTSFAAGGDVGFWKLGTQLAGGRGKQFRYLP